jgi:hypothetical protein
MSTTFYTNPSNWPPSVTEWTPPVTRTPDTACQILQLGIGLGASCGVVIFILLGVVISLCIENRSLMKYKRANEKQGPGKDNGHGQNGRQQQTVPAATSTVTDPSTQYEQPLAPASYREYARIDPYYHSTTAGSESSNYYETPLS